MEMNQRIPKLPNVEQINTQQIQRRAAKTSVSFIEMLEKQHGWFERKWSVRDQHTRES